MKSIHLFSALAIQGIFCLCCIVSTAFPLVVIAVAATTCRSNIEPIITSYVVIINRLWNSKLGYLLYLKVLDSILLSLFSWSRSVHRRTHPLSYPRTSLYPSSSSFSWAHSWVSSFSTPSAPAVSFLPLPLKRDHRPHCILDSCCERSDRSYLLSWIAWKRSNVWSTRGGHRRRTAWSLPWHPCSTRPKTPSSQRQLWNLLCRKRCNPLYLPQSEK